MRFGVGGALDGLWGGLGWVGMLGHRYLARQVGTVAESSYRYRAPLVADLCPGGVIADVIDSRHRLGGVGSDSGVLVNNPSMILGDQRGFLPRAKPMPTGEEA